MADGAAALALSATVAEFDWGGTEDHDASPPWSFVELREIVPLLRFGDLSAAGGGVAPYGPAPRQHFGGRAH